MSEHHTFFYDGKSAIKHEVSLHISRGYLEILGGNGLVMASWPYQSMSMVDHMPETGQARFSSPNSPEALLLIEDQGNLDGLEQVAPFLFTKKKKAAKSSAMLVFLILVAFIGGYFGLSMAADGLASFIPRSWEEPLARSTESQVLAMFGKGKGENRFCQQSSGVKVLNEMTKRLTLGGVDNLTSVRVVRSDIINAFAIPGGRIFIFKGLIDNAKSEAEVAGVLAHEMGHVQERHPLAGALKQFGLSTIIRALSGGSDLAGAAGLLASFSYTRTAEEEADHIAAGILKQSGYGTEGLAQFFKRLNKKGLKLPALLSTHPTNDQRVKSLQEQKVTTALFDIPNRIATLKTICD